MNVMEKEANPAVKTPIYSGLYKSIIQYIDINDISTPRSPSLGKETLKLFCASLSQKGFLRPLFVGGEGALLDGRRRLAAAKVLGFERVPCVFAPTPLVFEDDLMILKLREEDPGFFDYAEALRVLTEEYLYSQEAIARALGRSQSFVANKLRLLRFSEEERKDAAALGLTERHCRALLAIADQPLRHETLRRVAASSLSVGATEELVSQMTSSARRGDPASDFDRELRSLVSRYEGPLGLIFQTSSSGGLVSYTITQP